MRTTFLRTLLLAAITAGALMAGAAGASAATVRVDANGVGGWAFNPDPTTSTPYEFSTAFESIGSGSLHVLPITNTNGSPGRLDKFIAAHDLGTAVTDLSSLSFDFMIDPASATGPTAFKQFYINVYANLPSSTTFFDCRYDYVAHSGSNAAFTTVTATPTTVPDGTGDRADAFTCPATLSGMPAGSTVRAFALNVGDTSLSDTGVGGYLDNVVVDQASGSTTYDFEATPASKDDCKNGGFAAYGFANQGQCVARVNALARP